MLSDEVFLCCCLQSKLLSEQAHNSVEKRADRFNFGNLLYDREIIDK